MMRFIRAVAVVCLAAASLFAQRDINGSRNIFGQLRVGAGDNVYLGGANPFVAFNAVYQSGWKYGNASPDNYAFVVLRDASGNLQFASAPTGAAGAAITFDRNWYWTRGGVLAFGGTTSSYPGLDSSSAVLRARLADGSGFARFQAAAATSQYDAVTLNASSQVDLSLIPTCSQAEAEAGTATTCLSTAERVAQAIAALQVFQAAGTGVSCSSGTCGSDFSVNMRWSVSAGTPTGTPTAGSIWNLDTTNGRPYYAIGGSWVRIPTYSEVAPASHTHAASDLASGTIATARLGSGTADSTTFLRGDNTWAVPAGGGGSSAGEYSGTVDALSVPDLACRDTTFSATGATTSMIIEPGLPSALESGLLANVWVSSADTVSVRTCNLSGAALDPASATYKAKSVGSLGLLTGSGTVNLSNIPDMSWKTATITVTGAAAGDHVVTGIPDAIESGVMTLMHVTSANTVTVTLVNLSGAPVSVNRTFKAAIVK